MKERHAAAEAVVKNVKAIFAANEFFSVADSIGINNGAAHVPVANIAAENGVVLVQASYMLQAATWEPVPMVYHPIHKEFVDGELEALVKLDEIFRAKFQLDQDKL
jgi:hypothetical protein